MKWLLEHKMFVMIVVGILFIHLFLVGFHFYSSIEIPDVSIDPIVLPNEDELVFQNNSSMSDHEVNSLLLQMRESLRSLFYEPTVYLLSSIDPSSDTSLDSKYYVFDESFLKTLDSLVTTPIYRIFYEKMTLLPTVDSVHIYYIADRNIFDSVHFDSAIAEVGIGSCQTRLILATDEVINASVTLSSCKEVSSCEEKMVVPFELQKVEGTWKVSAFLK